MSKQKEREWFIQPESENAVKGVLNFVGEENMHHDISTRIGTEFGVYSMSHREYEAARDWLIKQGAISPFKAFCRTNGGDLVRMRDHEKYHAA